MAGAILRVSLSYSGGIADENELDFYDVAQALIGFERSLALTTHLILNGEIITQAPFLDGARIAARPPIEGSWEFVALVYLAGRGAYKLGTTPRDTPIGHLISSAYDYVVSHVVGVHVDYEKVLGAQLQERDASRRVDQIPTITKLDALAEKCETAVSQIHRPIVKTRSASRAMLTASVDEISQQIGPIFDDQTFDYIAYTKDDESVEIVGRVTSYNMNTFKGRVFVLGVGRPVPFELMEQCRDTASVGLVADSLSRNVQSRGASGDIHCRAVPQLSRTNVLKKYLIFQVGKNELPNR